MSNFGTVWRQCLEDTREVAGNATRVKLAVIDSVEHHQPMRFWFTEADFTIKTALDDDTYGLSGADRQNLMYIDGSLWVDIDDDPNNRFEVARRSVSFLEKMREQQAYSNWPEYFAVKGDQLLVWPVPDGVHRLRFRGDLKFPKPRKHYDSANSVWLFPDGDSFTHALFQEGERSIREYANYLHLGGPTSDIERARTHLQRHLEALDRLRAESDTRLMAPRPDPWPLVMPG